MTEYDIREWTKWNWRQPPAYVNSRCEASARNPWNGSTNSDAEWGAPESLMIRDIGICRLCREEIFGDGKLEMKKKTVVKGTNIILCLKYIHILKPANVNVCTCGLPKNIRANSVKCTQLPITMTTRRQCNHLLALINWPPCNGIPASEVNKSVCMCECYFVSRTPCMLWSVLHYSYSFDIRPVVTLLRTFSFCQLFFLYVNVKCNMLNAICRLFVQVWLQCASF